MVKLYRYDPMSIGVEGFDLTDNGYSSPLSYKVTTYANYWYQGQRYGSFAVVNETWSWGTSHSYFGGQHLQFQNGHLTAGILQTVVANSVIAIPGQIQQEFTEQSWTELSINAAHVYEASLTTSSTDDIAVWQDVLSGDDTIEAGSSIAPFISDLVSVQTNSRSIIHGFDGNDTITTYAGVDRLFGDDGNDIIKAGNNGDFLYGGLGADKLFGERGNDTIYGGYGDDTLHGGNGNDRLFGLGQADTLFGGQGNDVLNGGYGNDTLNGNFGNDRLYGALGNDRLNGGFGDDTINGGVGNDFLTGYLGSDILNGGVGSDTIYGGAGADTFIGGLGADKMNAGSDVSVDTFVFSDISESQVGSKHDQIYQFESGEDVLDLSAIDADSNSAGDQAFTFTGLTATANSVWLDISGSQMLVHADVNGDAVADFEIEMVDTSTLVNGDFVL